MRSLYEISGKFASDIDEVNEWMSERYDALFGDTFGELLDMQSRLESKERPITDEELEWTLTTLPLNLITVAETLNQLRLEFEVIKLKNQKSKTSLTKSYIDDPSLSKYSATMRNEMVSAELIEYQILQNAYSSLITRVENQLLYSREFIMGAKKVWDSRRHAEAPMPTADTTQEDIIPDYIR